MRPYLAIIRDSFHAAFASRILWIVLVSIAVLLIVLAPIGYQEIYTVEFSREDINSRSRLTGLLGQAMEAKSETPAKRVAAALPEELRKQVNDSAKNDDRGPGSSEYVDAFNGLLESDQWFDAELWSSTQRLRELRELDEQADDELEDKARQRRARLRIEAALPGAFRARPDRSIQITYAYLETPIKLPISKTLFADSLNQLVYPAVLNFLLGVGAVFVGILVTSPIIPDMFQPGALHLLLSKPISRPSLYLSKFVGGCAFVFLCVTLLVSGLWLISGTRLDIWNIRLFYSVPVFVFLFMIYYSVSALAGLHWRSAVVSVAVTVVFWFMCFIVGTASGIFDALVADPARVGKFAVVGDEYLLATNKGSLDRVDTDGGRQQPLISSNFGNQGGAVTPVRLADGQVVVRNGGGFSEEAKLAIFDPSDGWKETLGINLPLGTQNLFPAPDGGLLAVSSSGVYHAPAGKLTMDPDADEKKTGLLGGFQRLLGNPANEFTSVLPSDFSFFAPADVALVESTGDLVVYSAGRLVRLVYEPEAEKWRSAGETELEGDNMLAAKITANSEKVIVARTDEQLKIFALETLEKVAEIPFDGTYSVMSLTAAPQKDDAVAVLSNKTAFKIDLSSSESPTISDSVIPYQGKIEAVGWSDAGDFWVSHHIDRLSQVDLDTGQIGQQIAPYRDIWRKLYAYLITPLRLIVPQTGEVGEVVVAAICGRSNIELAIGDRVERQELSVARPLLTCGIFTLVMLSIGCIYVYRQDF